MSDYNKRSRGPRRSGGRFQDSRNFTSDRGNFRARCADCQSDCTVPFKPNERKPVLCSNCFQKGKQGGRARFDQSDRRPSFGSSRNRSTFDKKPKHDGVELELKQIRRKLDQILDILQAVSVEEIDDHSA